jgi:AI-2 transport protein TqsA
MKTENTTNKGILTVLLFILGIISIAAIMAARSIIVPIILALFISIIFAQPILWMEKKKIPWGLGTLIVLLSALLVFPVLGGIIGDSISKLISDAPKYEERIQDVFVELIEGLNQLGANINTDQIFEETDTDKIMTFAAGAAGEIGKVVKETALVIMITVFMLFGTKNFLYKTELIEKIKSMPLLTSFDSIGTSVRHYLWIKSVISLITGILVWLWLIILGVEYAILWGVIAFLFNYIPSIGSPIAAIPAILLALIQLGVGSMVWTAVGYAVINVVMGNIVEPKVLGKGLGLSTLVVFLSLIIWGFILGIVGMFLAIPLTITIKLMLEEKESTRWLAVILGTEDEAKQMLKRQ